MDKILRKLGTRGLVIISLLLFVGIVCIFAFDMKAGLAVLAGASTLPFVFGMASGTITDGMSQVRTLKYAHTAILSSGDVIVVGGLVLIALNDTAANAENVFAYITKATMPKKAALAISIGDLVYWDATPGEITKTSGDGTMCGYCIKAADAADTTVDIFLFPDLTNIGTAEIADGAVTTVKLAAAATPMAKAIADPGNAGAIPVTGNGSCPIVTAGAETRTLAIPTFEGQMLSLVMKTDGGDGVITSAQAINQTGNNTITMNDAGDVIVLIGVQVGAALRWRVVVNDGCTLSTV